MSDNLKPFWAYGFLLIKTGWQLNKLKQSVLSKTHKIKSV